jgi:hypothetical protein
MVRADSTGCETSRLLSTVRPAEINPYAAVLHVRMARALRSKSASFTPMCLLPWQTQTPVLAR